MDKVMSTEIIELCEHVQERPELVELINTIRTLPPKKQKAVIDLIYALAEE